MNLSFDTNFTIKGEFWRPEEPGNIVKGKIEYGSDNEIKLILYGQFSESLDEIGIINGQKNGGQNLTLINNLFKNAQGGFEKYSEVTYSCEYIFYGQAFESEKEIEFKRVSFGFTNLEEWFNYSPFNRDRKLTKDWKLSGNHLPPKEVDIESENIKLKSSSTFYTHFSSRTHVNVDFSTFWVLKSDQKRSIAYLVDCIKLIQNFLTLCVDTACSTQFINAQSSEEDRGSIQIVRSRSFDNDFEKKMRHDMVITYQDIEDRIDLVLNNLFDLKNSFESIVNLFTANYYKSDTYQEIRFLNLTQAFEAYFRLTKDTLYISEDSYEELTDKLMSCYPSESNHALKQKINSTLQYANEYSLRKKLKVFIGSFESETLEYFGIEASTFVDTTVSNRNYYTHYDKDLKEDALKGVELLKREIKLKYLLLIYLFKDLGCSEELVLNGIKESGHASFFIQKA
jgi:hypothetical protein